MTTTKRRLRRIIGLLCVALAAPGALAQSSGGSASPANTQKVIHDPAPDQRPLVVFQSLGDASSTTIALAPATTSPAPAPPTITGPIGQHEVFGFAPYWTLPRAWSFAFRNLSTVAYFGLDVGPGGSLLTAGAGWTGYQSQDLVNLVTGAHQAGDRVVLVAKAFDQATLDTLASDPVGAGTRLGEALVAALRAKAMDGVNLDFEGLGAADRVGFSRFVAQLAAVVHRADPRYQVSIDTYGGSATDPGGFFDVSALAPSVDAFFVMAYDMESPGRASPNAPLSGRGPNDTAEVQAYSSHVPPSKVILGVPFYGYDWATSSGAPAATAVSKPTPETYANIVRAGQAGLWDPEAAVPWTSYQVGGTWHETYYDNPTSIALKAQLADAHHLAGVGVWALGMEDNDPAMLAALVGHGGSKKSPSATGSSLASSLSSEAGSSLTTPPASSGSTTTSPGTATSPMTGGPPASPHSSGSPTPSSRPPTTQPAPPSGSMALAGALAKQIVMQTTAADGSTVALLTGSGCFAVDVAGQLVAGGCPAPPSPAVGDPLVLAASGPLPRGAFAVVRAGPGATAAVASTPGGASAPAILTPDGWGVVVTDQAMTSVVALDPIGTPVGQVAVPPSASAGSR